MHRQTMNRIQFVIVIMVGLFFLAVSGPVVAAGSGVSAMGRLNSAGIRVIDISTGNIPQTISVYRGDTVQLAVSRTGKPFSISIPAFKISESIPAGQGMTVKFKAKTLGEYPFQYRLGTSDVASRSGRIVVRQYESSHSVIYKEFTAQQANDFIAHNSPLILDVRTPGENRQGRLNHSVLIPVQELARRLPEIKQYKNKDIFIYCRSGNRSTVAASIMEKNGFKRIYNLRYGIVDWVRQGLPIVK